MADRVVTDFMVVGLSHKSAPLSVREKLALGDDDVPKVLTELVRLPGVVEAMMVSTCNRVEVYVAGSGSSAADAVAAHLAISGGQALHEHLYRREGEAAVVHLFRVAASLDSMVVGEPQILGQVKEAYEVALTQGTVQGELSRACQAAFASAKRVRSETQIGSAAVSMAAAAVRLAQKLFGDLRNRGVLVVGAGLMSELCVRHLLQHGAKVRITNRTPARAEALAKEVGGGAEVRPFEQLAQHLVECDVVITSTAAPRPLFTPELIQAALKARRHRPLFFVDLAVPRDVDERVHQLDNVYAYDVDDLEKVINENLATRAGEAERANVIVAEEVARFMRARAAREAVPLLAQLRQRADEIARAEAERTLANIGDALNEKQRKSVEAMARAIVNKLLHEPTARLKIAGASGPEEAARVMQAAAELFGLGASESESSSANEPAPLDVPQPAVVPADGGV